jgi:Prenyltransferase and squalene oxidase repeat
MDASELLATLRNPDGGFALRAGQVSEAEPTALAAMALGDHEASEWLRRHQRNDGAFVSDPGPYENDSGTSICCLALPPGPQRERALDHLENNRAEPVVPTAAIPVDATAVGWGWTSGAASWVEPSSRALWAFRVARPASPRIADAVAFMRDRETTRGGWNYGNRIVLHEELPPFAQTTAVGLIGLRGFDPDLEARALRELRRLWREESAGGLTLAMSVAAFRVHDDAAEATAAGIALRRLVATTELLGDGVALGWAALALSDHLPGVAT